MQPIVMTACARADYTREVIDALQRCRGIEDHILIVRAEPGHPDVGEVLRSYRHPCFIRTNPAKLGCNTNTIAALADGFAVSDWVIHIEDDTVPAPDALEYLAWARGRCAMAGCYRPPTGSKRGDMTGVVWDRWFWPWVWACDRGVFVRHVGCVKPENSVSWDSQLNQSMARAGELLQLCPAWARSHNIGAHGGVHVPGEQWHRRHQLNLDWIGLDERDPVVWDEPGEPPELPKPARRVPSWRQGR